MVVKMRDKYAKIIAVFILLGFVILITQIGFDSFTGLVTGLPYENGYEGAVCWGNATFDCSECSGEDCVNYGCSLSGESGCIGESANGCGDYTGDEEGCLNFGCSYEGEDCVGELVCEGQGESPCGELEGCSWDAGDCGGVANCTEISSSNFCGLASGCLWSEADCSDGEDGDEDGQTDCADSDCNGYFNEEGSWDCEYSVEVSCDDGYDNDGDGDTDLMDSDCVIGGSASAICSGNATFDCSECVENCTDFGCSYTTASCGGNPEGSCEDYDRDRVCGWAGCNWNEDHCEGELLCSNFEDGDGCTSVEGCSWQEEDCSGASNCSEITESFFCGSASGCDWIETDCNNSVDDDNDGDLDCADSDCDGFLYLGNYCETPLELNCADGFDNDGDSNIDCNDTNCNDNINCISEIPDYDGFLGRTTNFSTISDLENVSNLTLEVLNKGLIEWINDGLNVSYINFSKDIVLGVNSIFVNSSNLNANLNSSANLTIFNVTGFSKTPIILMDGEYCSGCVLNNYDGENISFTVPHFTNYSLGVNTELMIYDSYERSLVYNETDVTFFANYTNRTDGSYISDAVCNISFDDGTSTIMNWGNENYNYTKINGLDLVGLHFWNVSCNKDDFEKLISSDNITVIARPIVNNCSNINFGSWNKTFGGTGLDDAKEIILTDDCGFIVVGDTTSYGEGDQDIWALKLNSSGDLQWNKTFGTVETEEVYGVEEFSDESIVLVGFKETVYSFGQAWILKLNSSGDLQWNKTFGISQSVAKGVVETSEGDIAIIGQTRDYGVGDYDFWTLKLNSSGDLQWNNTFGGINSDLAYAITDSQDGIVIVGGMGQNLYKQISSVKYDYEGNMIWNFTTNQFDVGKDITSLESGGFLISGENFGGSGVGGSYDLFALKLNSSGDLQWNKTFGGVYSEYGGHSVETSDGILQSPDLLIVIVAALQYQIFGF